MIRVPMIFPRLTLFRLEGIKKLPVENAGSSSNAVTTIEVKGHLVPPHLLALFTYRYPLPTRAHQSRST